MRTGAILDGGRNIRAGSIGDEPAWVADPEPPIQ